MMHCWWCIGLYDCRWQTNFTDGQKQHSGKLKWSCIADSLDSYMSPSVADPAAVWGGGQKHEIYTAAFGGLFFWVIFTGPGEGAWPPRPPLLGSATVHVKHPWRPVQLLTDHKTACDCSDNYMDPACTCTVGNDRSFCWWTKIVFRTTTRGHGIASLEQ